MLDATDVTICNETPSHSILAEAMFSTRIVNVDHYQSFPSKGFDVCYSDFRGYEVYKVPVIRIFGITLAGQKTCLHVHGVFPYMTIPCEHDMPKNSSESNFRRYIQDLALSIDKSVNVALRSSKSNRHHVYKIVLVSGIPFYGYHSKEQPFLRIYFYNPHTIKKVAELFAAGAIMNRVIQPYEAHIPYILQFFIDYKLFGMNFISLRKLKFRAIDEFSVAVGSPLRNLSHGNMSHRSSSLDRVWSMDVIKSPNLCSKMKKQTMCELEADCHADDILNKLDGNLTQGGNPCLQALWLEERGRRRQRQESSQLTPPPSQARPKVTESDSEIFFKEKLRNCLKKTSRRMEARNVEMEAISQKVCDGLANSSQKSDSQNSSLADSQDREMLSAFLGIVNEQTASPDQDSILSVHAACDSDLEAEDEAVTAEMSQHIFDSIDDWECSPQPWTDHLSGKHNSQDEELLFSPIPQLDGTDDRNIELISKQQNVPVSPQKFFSAENLPSIRPTSCVQSPSPVDFMTTVSVPPKRSSESLLSLKDNTPHGNLFQYHGESNESLGMFSKPRKRKNMKPMKYIPDNQPVNSSAKTVTSFHLAEYSGSIESSSSVSSVHLPATSDNFIAFNSDQAKYSNSCQDLNARHKNGITKTSTQNFIPSKLSLKLRRKPIAVIKSLIHKSSEKHNEIKASVKPDSNFSVVTSKDTTLTNRAHSCNILTSDVPSDSICEEGIEKIGSELEKHSEGHGRILKSPRRVSKDIISTEGIENNDCGSPVSPGLKMKFKFKRLSTRSKEPRIYVVEKEFHECPDKQQTSFSELSLPKVKLKYSEVSGRTNQNFTKEHLSNKKSHAITKELIGNLQNKNLGFESPLLEEDESTTKDENKNKVPSKLSKSKHLSHMQGKKYKLNSLLLHENSEGKHPSDVQDEKLSELNLILMRDKRDGFHCIKPKSTNQNIEPVMSSSNILQEKNSLKCKFKYSKSGSQLVKLDYVNPLAATADASLKKNSTKQKRKLPKLHLKLNTGDQWTAYQPQYVNPCKTNEPEEPNAHRRRKTKTKVQKVALPYCSAVKNSSVDCHDSFSQPSMECNIAEVHIAPTTSNKPEISCTPCYVKLSRLGEDVVKKYTSSCKPELSGDHDEMTLHNSRTTVLKEETQLLHLSVPPDCSVDLERDKTETICKAEEMTESKLPCLMGSEDFQISSCIADDKCSEFSPGCTDENIDVMWNMSYFSPVESASWQMNSPPRCWSPNPDNFGKIKSVSSNEKFDWSLPVKNEVKLEKTELDASNSTLFESMKGHVKEEFLPECAMPHIVAKNSFLFDKHSPSLPSDIKYSPLASDFNGSNEAKICEYGEPFFHEEKSVFTSSPTSSILTAVHHAKNNSKTSVSSSSEDIENSLKDLTITEHCHNPKNAKFLHIKETPVAPFDCHFNQKLMINSFKEELNAVKPNVSSCAENCKLSEDGNLKCDAASKGPIVYDISTEAKHQVSCAQPINSIRTENESQKVDELSKEHSVHDDSDLFTVLPSTQLSLYSMLDDDINASQSTLYPELQNEMDDDNADLYHSLFYNKNELFNSEGNYEDSLHSQGDKTTLTFSPFKISEYSNDVHYPSSESHIPETPKYSVESDNSCSFSDVDKFVTGDTSSLTAANSRQASPTLLQHFESLQFVDGGQKSLTYSDRKAHTPAVHETSSQFLISEVSDSTSPCHEGDNSSNKSTSCLIATASEHRSSKEMNSIGNSSLPNNSLLKDAYEGFEMYSGLCEKISTMSVTTFTEGQEHTNVIKSINSIPAVHESNKSDLCSEPVVHGEQVGCITKGQFQKEFQGLLSENFALPSSDYSKNSSPFSGAVCHKDYKSSDECSTLESSNISVICSAPNNFVDESCETSEELSCKGNDSPILGYNSVDGDDILSKLVKSCDIDVEFDFGQCLEEYSVPGNSICVQVADSIPERTAVPSSSSYQSDRNSEVAKTHSGDSVVNSVVCVENRSPAAAVQKIQNSNSVIKEHLAAEAASISKSLVHTPKHVVVGTMERDANFEMKAVKNNEESFLLCTPGIHSFYGNDAMYGLNDSIEFSGDHCPKWNVLSDSSCIMKTSEAKEDDILSLTANKVEEATKSKLSIVGVESEHLTADSKRLQVIKHSEENLPSRNSQSNLKLRNAKSIAHVWMPSIKPPTRDEVQRTAYLYGLPEEKHQHAFYSNVLDSDLKQGFAGIEFQAEVHSISKLLEFDGYFPKPTLSENQNFLSNTEPSASFSLLDEVRKNKDLKTAFADNRPVVLMPSHFAPSLLNVKKWLGSQKVETSDKTVECVGTVKQESIGSEGIPAVVKEPVCTKSFAKAYENCTSETERVLSLNIVSESPTLAQNKTRDFRQQRFCSQQLYSTPIHSKASKLGKIKAKGLFASESKENCISGDECEKKDALQAFKETCVFSPITAEDISPLKKRKLEYDVDDYIIMPEKKKAQSSDARDETLGNFAPNNTLVHALHNSSSSQIEGPTLKNTGNFQVSWDNATGVRISHENQHLTVMSLEIHVNTRGELNPNPAHDAVSAVFFCISDGSSNNEDGPKRSIGIIFIDSASGGKSALKTKPITSKFPAGFQSVPAVSQNLIFCVEDENSLFEQLISMIANYDPDFVVGYEIQKLSLGYLLERARHINIDLKWRISRLIEERNVPIAENQNEGESDSGADQSTDVHIIGRVVLNVWRLMRKEVTLNIYTFENVYYHVLHKRTPLYSFHTLTRWYSDKHQPMRWKVISYYVTRALGNIELLERLNVIGQTSELARLFGIQFFEVLSRGSQFRVESMMLRVAKPLGYVPVSPTIRQRSLARAPECIPLILEPESRFYVDPVLVLDFQSLYPSMIIAYNYCFSTCLGRLEHFEKNVPFEFGCTSLTVTIELLRKLGNSIHISPTGIAFVKPDIRRGILPMMLEEILNTRVMVKQSLKLCKSNKAQSRLLDARQLGLKLISNVTYGYTAANFSGRMPCVEVADSIVGKGRETLERAIHFIEESKQWRAKVVYGDTDSMFVLLPGRSKEQAFKIGQDIADAITALNPKPVKLKFEKVYLPCVLQTKKRYVGYMYETLEQKEPIYDAKGIETVRRDTCSAAAKILEKSLKILFESRDVSLVKQYVQKQFQKLLSGRSSVIDCVFAKEYRGRAGYRPGACVPALEIAKKRLLADPRSEPCVGERVPYLIVYGFPGSPVIQLVKEPVELLRDSSLRINAKYYITRVIIPPLDRVLSLIGANVHNWYTSVSHMNVPSLPMVPTREKPRGTLSQYFTVVNCPVCNQPTDSGLCFSCQQDAQTTTVVLNEKIRQWERTYHHLKMICNGCMKSSGCIDSCISIDCPILFRLIQAKKDISQAPYLRNLLLHELF